MLKVIQDNIGSQILSSLLHHNMPSVENGKHLSIQKDDLGIRKSPTNICNMWRDFIRVPNSLIVTSSLASTVLLFVIISSLTVQSRGPYIHLDNTEQTILLQPHYNDPDGPMELGGSHRCGSYPSQAEALGCVFDIINFAWTAPECYHKRMSEAHISEGAWKWRN